MPQSRQLAAIMFTDIVGYTALMGDDEQRAFEILNKNRKLQKPLIEQYGGKWIKELGDGVLATFSTVTDAVSCACSIISECKKAEGLQLRIGIHQAEVVFENGDVFGDGVNIASRLQSIAPIGGICISETVKNNVANRKEIKTAFIKEETLKHVKEPVRIYEVIIDFTEIQQPSIILSNKEPAKIIPEKSIAVLPFVNMSSDPEQEYFSDGIAEEILNSLVHLKNLKVAGRTSSFQFKGKNIDLREVGEKLHVRTVLEGSVRKQGNRLRITAQLINVEDGYHLWSERYDREMDDIFAVQDEIASKIAEYLKITFFGSYETKDEKKPTDNLEAYELFLKGSFYHSKYTVEGVEKSIEYFKKAVELDPNYADAWWLLGLANNDMQLMLFLPSQERVETARYCAKKAIQIDETNSYAHYLLALIYMNNEWDWKKAGAEIQTGNKYNLNKSLYLLPLEGWYRSMVYGDFDFAVNRLQRGIENDPLSITLLLHLSMVYLYAVRDYTKARITLNRILELDSNYSKAWSLISFSWLFEGNNGLAEQYALKYYNALDGKGDSAANLIMCLAASGKKYEAQQLYQSHKETQPLSQFSASLHAKVNAYLGQLDEAFEYLDKALEQKEIWLFTLKYSSKWDLFRSDARFQKVLERMNFPN